MSTNLPALPELMKDQQFFSGVCQMMRQNQMMARLGEGDMLFLHEAGQTKRAFKVKVNLEYGKHFAFPAGPDQKSMILGEGYDFINQYAGIEIIRPKTLMAQDGSERGNPFFDRDPKTGSLNSMFIRGLAIGYSPTGNLVAIDKTIFVNLPTLLVQEVQAKIKKHPSLGMMGTRDQRPSEITYYKDNGKWGKQKVVDSEPTTVKAVGAWHFIGLTGDLGYWVNISHPEIQAAFESFSQKQRFLDRSAGTILNRLLLAQHPAIATKTPIVTDLEVTEEYGKKVKSAKAHVFVYGWTADTNPRQKRDDIVAMADRLAAGEDAANLSVKLDKADVTDVSAEAEVIDVTHAEADPSEIPAAGDDDGWSNEPVEPVTTPTVTEPPPPPPEKKDPPPMPPIRHFLCQSCFEYHAEQQRPTACRKCGDCEGLKEYPTMAAAKKGIRNPVPAEPKPTPEATKQAPPAESRDISKFLREKTTDPKIAVKIRNELKFDDFTALKAAPPDVVADFFARYDAAAAGK